MVLIRNQSKPILSSYFKISFCFELSANVGIEKIKKEIHSCRGLLKISLVLAFPKKNRTKIQKTSELLLSWKRIYIGSCHCWADIVPMVIRSLFNQENGTVKTSGITERRH